MHPVIKRHSTNSWTKAKKVRLTVLHELVKSSAQLITLSGDFHGDDRNFQPVRARRGPYFLPGYLSTSGSQLIDANGNPVRIDSIGWNGPDGPAGSTLQGLSQVSFQTMLDAIKADGFNTVRIPWSDVSLTSMPSQNAIDFSKNPSLQGLNVLQIFQQIVAYSGQVGLKIIFDHHTDDGGPNGWGGQQANGLWFDSGTGQ